MKSIRCAICKNHQSFKILYKSNIRKININSDKYIPKRVPDGLHYRIVKCKKCGLVYSNPIFNSKQIIELYKNSGIPKHIESDNTNQTYLKYLSKFLPNLSNNKKILEIGCGDGSFLREMKKINFSQLYGIEPSTENVSNVSKELNKKNIINDIFKKNQFPKNYFDLICFFQVFDHIINPNEFLRECKKILKPGGYMFAIMHNSKSVTATILKEKSPIFDIQHIYLFDKQTIREIFDENGFIVMNIFNVSNQYSVSYWIKMAPLPKIIKDFLLKAFFNKLLKINLCINAGNMGIIVRKNLEK